MDEIEGEGTKEDIHPPSIETEDESFFQEPPDTSFDDISEEGNEEIIEDMDIPSDDMEGGDESMENDFDEFDILDDMEEPEFGDEWPEEEWEVDK